MRRNVATVLALAVAAASSSAYGIVTVTESFNDDPISRGWSGVANTPATSSNANNYGFSTTDNTGSSVNPAWGAATPGGEFGGFVNRGPNSFYGVDLGGAFDPNTMNMSIQGVMQNPQRGSSTTLNMGWSQGIASANGSGGEPGAMLGIAWDDGLIGNVMARGNGFGIDNTGWGVGPERTISTTVIPFAMSWDFATRTLTVSLDTNSASLTLAESDLNDVPDLTHWGLWGRTDSSPDNGNTIWIDDVQYTAITQLATTPGWTLDNTGSWQGAGNWAGGIPNAIDATAKFASPDATMTSAHLVYSNSDVTVGTLEFNTATQFLLAGLGTLTMEVSTGSGLIEATNGSHKINLPVVVASDTDVAVSGGATLRISDPVTVNSGVAVTTSGAGSLIIESTVTLLSGASISLASSQHLAGLTVGAGATATIASGGGNNRVLQVDSLSINSGSGKVDITDNKMISNTMGAGTQTGGVYNGVQGLVQSANNPGGGGLFDGASGITTSQADATNGSGLTTVGVSTGALARFLGPTDTEVWGGQIINGDSTMVMYTYIGDANLDGFLDGTDYFYIDNGISTPGSDGFANGDFNYDGVIDSTDYFYIDNNIALGLPIISTSGGSESLASVEAVPEPTSLSLIGLGAAALIGRRRRAR